ncbi:hypothetical protein ICA16_20270 [Pseudomonas anatoliensis]|uniref:hypothetical protein n=1 Tax=Pseudomonas anatoliensis TaxID=2710589 RepID=UPI001B32DD25|nr:hypothetical protein [Pseudomonas anatoliensis]MBP5958014.1 hypothetical protein [Pseudomonas anatoliensis]
MLPVQQMTKISGTIRFTVDKSEFIANELLGHMAEDGGLQIIGRYGDIGVGFNYRNDGPTGEVSAEFGVGDGRFANAVLDNWEEGYSWYSISGNYKGNIDFKETSVKLTFKSIVRNDDDWTQTKEISADINVRFEQ